jgi:hypothetical protein
MKKILGVFLVLIISLFIFIPGTKSKVKPYYSGEAISFAGQVVVGTINSGALEIFKLENKTLIKIADLSALDQKFGLPKDFEDLEFNNEAGRLYVYAVSQYEIYKYDLTSLSEASLVKKRANNSWEWYNGIDKLGDDLVTKSAKGINVINTDNLDVINSYKITNTVSYNLNSNVNRFIFNILSTKVEVYDRESRTVVRDLPVIYDSANANHKVFSDQINSRYYVVDDYSLRQYDFNGKLLNSFKHLEHPGYDVVNSTDNNFIYFSNGVGVVKMDKATMEPKTWRYTTTLGEKEGWAMGLELVRDSTGDKLVIFNASNILVLDEKLNKVASIKASREETSVVPKETLSLGLDREFIQVGHEVYVVGTGYLPNEKIELQVFDAKFYTDTNSLGRFNYKLTIPGDVAGRAEIKAVGQTSGLHYSLAFSISN